MDENPITPKEAPDQARSGKFIRTFAGDMETLKGGGVPDLAPLGGSSLTPPSPAAAPAPVAPPVPPSPAPAPFPSPVSTLAPERPIPLQTYAGDFSQRMKETHATAATVLAAEQDSAKGVPFAEEPEKSSRGGILYVIAGGALLIIGVTAAYFAYSRYGAQVAPVILAPAVTAPIFVDDREQISGADAATLMQAIVQSNTRTIAAGSVRLLYLDPASSESVFSALRLPAPDILRRNVNTAGSMAGVVNVSGSQSLFFILSVTSYSDTFSGMLSWEAQMPHDLAQLFPPYPSPAPSLSMATSTMATSTAKTNVKAAPKATSTPSLPAFQPGFIDEAVANHDARVYRDANGKTVLIYGYWNQKTLVIARNEAAFTEILGRLATSRSQ
ncbi:MAG: hypothetical protein KGH56_01360 [Patescibacteria group bacterium]|nr:hypothetical protein [Patescibacteria group bacterium]